MNMNKIVFYDFDGTLINTPEPETGKKQWEKKYKKMFPYLGWWSKKESLDLDVFDIKPFTHIKNRLNKDFKDPETYVVILTSRIDSLKNQLKKILDANDIEVDEISTRTKDRNKSVRIKDFLTKFPNVKSIEVYDDREVELVQLRKLKKSLKKDGIDFEINKVKEGKMVINENKFKLITIINNELLNYFKVFILFCFI